MQLPQLLKHYKLDSLQLIRILISNGIYVDLRLIKHVPEDWLPLLSEATNIKAPVLNSKSEYKKQPCTEESAIVISSISEPVESGTGVVVPTQNIFNSLREMRAFKSANEDNNSKSTTLESPIKGPTHTRIDNKNQKRANVKKDYFWAYVRFVVPEKNFGFVKRIDDLENIDPNKLTLKDENDYHIKLGEDQLKGEQLILCSSISETIGRKQAYIEAIAFKGIVKDHSRLRKVFDLSSRFCPQGFQLADGNLPKYTSGSQLTLALSITSGKINANEISSVTTQLELNEFRNFDAFKRLSKKETLTADDLELIQVLNEVITNRDEVVKVYQESFNQEKKTFQGVVDKSAFQVFLNKWLVLCPDLLSKSNLDVLVDDNFYMNRWLQGQMPVSFWEDKLDNICWNYLSERNPEETLTIVSSLKKILNGTYESDFINLINRYCQNVDIIGTAEEFIHLKKIAEATSEPVSKTIELELLNKLAPLVKLELWLEHETDIFPKTEAIGLFGACLPKQQEKIVKHLEEEDFKKVLKFLTPVNNPSVLQKARGIVENEIIDKLAPVSLDIESDGTEIFELAWGNKAEWVSGVNAEESTALLEELLEMVQEKDPLLVGHNIIDFDIPILEKKASRIIEAKVWDTLLVEMVLSPGLRAYSLNTAHHALEDATLTLQLFLNQVLRILQLTEDDWSIIGCIFSPTIQSALQELRNSFAFGWLHTPATEPESLSYYRPHPHPSSLLQELTEKIEASEYKTKLILASTDFLEELRTIPGIQFQLMHDANLRFRELDEAHIVNQLGDSPLELSLAKSFFNYCRKSGISPLAVNLPPIFRQKLSKKIEIETAVKAFPTLDCQHEQIICLDIHELAKQEESLLHAASDVGFFVVEPDLISLTFKKLLKEVDLAYIIHNPTIENLWIRFSGGQSFIELTKDQVVGLEVDFPDGFNNFWIEKYVYGKYRIWGNYSWENHLAGFPTESITKINRKETGFPKEQTNYLVVDQKKLQKDIGVTRFNPESIYRSRYWLIQKELIEGITRIESEQKPLVFLIQRHDEVESVEQYFQSMGYYIPSGEASLGRRLELLHQNKRSRKILIATVSEASQIIDANYLGAVNLVLDCFNLYESYYLAKGTDLFTKSITASGDAAGAKRFQDEGESIGEDGSGKVNPSDNIAFHQRDIFFLLSLQLPFINRLRALLLDDSSNNKLWLLDARIEDFSDLGKKWNAQKVGLEVWKTKEAYSSDAKVADACILSPKPDNELPFSVDEAKEILSSVFLPENATWHDYQVPYLDKILTAENNILVSLPTGGGKSLLFQAPALFRSSFTNRLTIVITPLKALMEDQVKALWDLGFYGSVEYINQDKSDEVLHIYRRLAGGEISMLFITPERFRSGGFIKAFTQRFDNDGGLEYAVYDEAHCISQWGHEFRPDYLYSGRSVQRFKDMNERKFPVLLFSATVSEKIYRDLNLIFK